MNMKKLKIIICMVLSLTLMFSTTSLAYADELEDVISTIKQGKDEEIQRGKYKYYQEVWDDLKNTLRAFSASYDNEAKLVEIDDVKKLISKNDRETLLELARKGLDEAKTKTASSEGKGKSVDEVKREIDSMLRDDFDLKVDVSGAAEIVEGLREPLGYLIGLLAYAVIIGMGVFTVLDICYIELPLFRGWCTDEAQGGNKLLGKTDKRTGETKVRWISDAAVYAVKTATIEEGRSPLKVYFIKRFVSYIIIAIIIFVLLTDNIQIFVNLALDIVAGAIEKIQELANK